MEMMALKETVLAEMIVLAEETVEVMELTKRQ